MNNNNGALSFEADFNNEKFNGAVEEAKRRVQGFSAATVKEGEKIDDVFKLSAENIRIQKDVIAQIESQIKHLNAEIGKTAPGMAQNDLRKQAAQLTTELNGEKAALTMLEQQVKETEASHVSFRTQLRNVREELIAMEQAGLRGTDAYNVLQAKAGQLNDAYKDAQQQMNVLANDEKGFRGVVSLVTGVTGAFAAAQGAVGLFAGENENLNRIMQKANFLMAITIGLQQASETFNKDSFFSLTLLKKIKEALIVTETKLATAFGISTAAARVFMATLTLGLSAAITGAIVLISKFVSKQRELSKEQEKFNSAVADTVSKPIVQVERLSIAWSKLGDDIKAKEKFLKDHADTFKDLGTNVKSVADAENLLIKNKDAFILAQIAKAKALAATDKAVELAKEQYAIEAEMETTAKTKKVINYNTGATEEYENAEYRKLRKRNEKLQEELKKLYEDAAGYELEAIEGLVNAGISAVGENIDNNIETLVDGSIGAFEKLIRIKQDTLKNLTNPSDYRKVEEEIKKLQERIDYITGKKSIRSKETMTPIKMIGSVGVEGSEEIKKDLDQLKTYISSNIQFIDDLQDKSIRKIKEYIAKLKEELKYSKAITDEKRKAIQVQIEASEKVLDEKELENIYNIADTFMGISQIMEGIDQSMSEAAKHVAVLVEGVASIVQGIASKNYSQAAAGAINLISEYVKLFDTTTQKEKQAAEILAKRAQQFKEDLEAITNIQFKVSDTAGEERIKGFLGEIGLMNREIDEKLTALNNIRNVNIPENLSSDTISAADLNVLYNQLRQMDLTNESDAAYQLYKELREMYETRQRELNALNEELLGSSFQSISDSIKEGFENSLTTVVDFGENVKSIMRRALMESFQTKFLDAQLQDWFNSFGAAASDGSLTESEIGKYKTALEGVISNSSIAFEQYKKMIEEMGLVAAANSVSQNSSLTGNIKGVSEETASALGGQINAIRINQAESIAVIRSQLMYLSQIASNTSYNWHLQKLSQIVDILNRAGSETLRSQGIAR